MPPSSRAALLDALAAIARRAGEAILRVYDGPIDVTHKDDDSPLTAADLASHRTIADALAALEPQLPIVSEESGLPPFDVRASWPAYWLVDPLDGTKEFLARNGEFTVNIALIEGGRPTCGVVGVPARQQVFGGVADAGTAWCETGGTRRTIQCRPFPGGAPVVVASRRHGGEHLAAALSALERRYGGVETRNVGSALKICLLASGDADLYPRLAPTSEWDTAAAQAVLEAAGGAVWRLDGWPLIYTKADILNPSFVAVADPSIDWLRDFRADGPLQD